MNMLRCVLKAAKYEKQKPVSRILGRDDIFESRELVYFEQQIVTLLLVHPTPKVSHMSRIKFSHISRQVKGLCLYI